MSLHIFLRGVRSAGILKFDDLGEALGERQHCQCSGLFLFFKDSWWPNWYEFTSFLDLIFCNISFFGTLILWVCRLMDNFLLLLFSFSEFEYF